MAVDQGFLLPAYAKGFELNYPGVGLHENQCYYLHSFESLPVHQSTQQLKKQAGYDLLQQHADYWLWGIKPYPDRASASEGAYGSYKGNYIAELGYEPDSSTFYLAQKRHKPIDERALSLIYARILEENHGLLVHAGGALFQHYGLVYPAFSGQGKSTFSQLLAQSGASVLHDDRLAFFCTRSQWMAASLPRYVNDTYTQSPIHFLFFLEHGKNETQSLSANEAYLRLLNHSVYFDQTIALFQSLRALAPLPPAYSFGFKPDASAMAYLKNQLLNLQDTRDGTV